MIYFIGAGPGAPDLITVRGRSLLERAELVVYAGSLVNPQLLEVMKQNGGEVVLGSDSHHRDNVIFYFDECVEILKQNQIDHISVFNGKDFDKVAI